MTVPQATILPGLVEVSPGLMRPDWVLPAGVALVAPATAKPW